MTISLPGSSKKSFSGLFGRKKSAQSAKPTAKKQLAGEQLAKLFDKQARAVKPVRHAKLNESEKLESARLSSLRGALYSDE